MQGGFLRIPGYQPFSLQVQSQFVLQTQATGCTKLIPVEGRQHDQVAAFQGASSSYAGLQVSVQLT